MKFSIQKLSFLDALQQVQHIVGSRSTLPILSNVLIEANEKGLSLTTTDLDVSVKSHVEAKVSQQGTSTLPVRRLVSIIRALPTQEVEISIDNKDTASIQSGPSFFKIIGLNQEEFPKADAFDSSVQFTMNQELLLNAIKKTSYAISTDETRYVLNGIHVVFREGKMTLVATDGRRLALMENELEFPASYETDLIIPAKTVKEVERILSSSGEVTVSLSQDKIRFEVEKGSIISKLIDGNYPNYRQVIPSSRNHRVTLERKSFLETVSRVALLTSDSSNSIKLTFSHGELKLQANAKDIGEAQESLVCDYNGEEIIIAFNPDFLMAPLRNLEDDTFQLDLIDSMSPGVIQVEPSFLYVIMPMRVNA